MTTSLNPETLPPPFGPYSQGVLSAGHQTLHIAGQVGVRVDGSVGANVTEQAEIAWQSLLAVLAAAEMDPTHLVKINSYLTDAAYVADFQQIRSRFLGACRPASTLVIVKALIRPEWLVEVEAVAVREAPSPG